MITSANSFALPVNSAGSFTVTGTGTPVPSFSISGTLPAGIAFDPTTTKLGGTPASGTAGTYPLTVSATNGVPPNATQSFTLTVQKRNQTIAFQAPASPQYFNTSPVPLSAYASSMLPVSFVSNSASVCTISGANAIWMNQGGCSISAVQNGNVDFDAATTITESFLFAVAAQTISFPAQIPNSRVAGTGNTFPINPLATASSGLPVRYTAFGACTLSGTTVTIQSPGNCTIVADQAGDNVRYFAASGVQRSIALVQDLPGAPTITSISAGLGSATVNFTAPASDGGSFISQYTATCNPGNFTQTVLAFVGPQPISFFGLTNGTQYTCTVTATNISGTGPPSAPVTVTPGGSLPGQQLYQNNCTGCHFFFIPIGTVRNAAGSTETVL